MFGITVASLLFLLLTVAGLALPIYALVQLARTPAERRSLPVALWALLIVAFPFIGSIAFLLAGRR